MTLDALLNQIKRKMPPQSRVNHAIDFYKAELLKYAKFVHQLKSKHGPDKDYRSYGREDYEALLTWQTKFKAYEAILFISAEDTKKIDRETFPGVPTR